MNKPAELNPWEVIQFPWGVGVRHRKGDWTNIIFPDGQEMDLTKMGTTVVLHDNGIEFIRG